MSSAAASAPAAGPSGLARLRAQLKDSPMVALIIAGAASVAVIAALLLWANSPDYRVLYSNLSEADGGRIISELDARGVPYRFSQGGQALLVPGDQVHTLRLQLAEQGLPRGGNVGFELMENQAFGISQFAEQVNYQRGLEGELARSMETLGPVRHARVHLALAKDSVFVREREPAKASVVLTLQRGRTLGKDEVDSIVHMVASSVPDLAADSVSVIDQKGRLLTRAERDGLGLDGTQLSYIAEVERSYQRRIESILSPILGRRNIKAQVTAQIDFSQREETAERYGPNQPPNQAAVRSRQTRVDYQGSDDLAAGIPGALSNTVPGVAPSPVDDPAAGDDADTAAGGDDAEESPTRRLNRDDVINYEVDRHLLHTQHRRGRVERLSAAVVVNYRAAQDEAGTPQLAPLSEKELAQVERLARQAMGFSSARGDEIAVVNSPFTLEEAADETPEWWQSAEARRLALSAGRYLLLALVALLLYLLILRPLIRRVTQLPPASQAPAAGVDARAGDAVEDDDADDDADTTYTRPPRRRKSTAYEQNLSDLREMAQNDPRMVAMIVRSWMNKHE